MKKILLVLSLVTTNLLWAQQHDSYAVKEGDTLERIAKIFRVSPNDIKAFNPLVNNGLKKGMLLVIPNTKVVYYNTQQPIGFKYHVVKEKETLFGLAQSYDITQDDLRRYNISLYNKELQKNQELTIPIYKQQEEAVSSVEKGKEGLVKYVVKPKEGKWRIAQNHNISQKEFERINPNLPEILKEGMEVWVPKGHIIDDSRQNMVLYQVEKGEGFMSLERKFNLNQEQLIALNPELKNGIKLEAQVRIPKEVFMEYAATLGQLTESSIADSNAYIQANMRTSQVRSISYVIPFKLKNIKNEGTAEIRSKLQNDKMTGIATDFYSGALLAIDSLQKLGFNFKVNVFDSQASVQEIKKLSENEDLMQSQVVIGPFIPVVFNKLSDFFRDTETAVLAPVSNKNIELRPNVFQTLPTTDMQQEKMINFITKKYPDANIVLLSDEKSKDINEKLSVSFPDSKIVDNINSITHALSKNHTNIVFVSSNDVVFLSDVIRILYNTSGLATKEPNYNIIMATLDKGEAYDHSSISNTQLSALKFTYPSFNKYAGESTAFIQKYYDTYKISPNRYAFRGFDLTMDAVLRTSVASNFVDTCTLLGETFYQENRFIYVKNAQKGGGYENHGVYIVRYENLEVIEIY